MHLEYNPFVLAPLAAVVFCSLLVVSTWRRRDMFVVKAFNVLALLVMLWMVGYAFELASADRQTIIFWAKVQYLGIATAPVAALVTMHEFTGRSLGRRSRTILLLCRRPARRAKARRLR